LNSDPVEVPHFYDIWFHLVLSCAEWLSFYKHPSTKMSTHSLCCRSLPTPIL